MRWYSACAAARDSYSDFALCASAALCVYVLPNTMAQNGEQLGVSPPLSNDPPTDTDMKLNEALMQELKAQNNFESPDDTNKR